MIRAFYVDPDFGRRGLGRLLLETCETACTEAGFPRAELVSTLMGLEFYRANGYAELNPIDIELQTER